jgi:hypothetical protein
VSSFKSFLFCTIYQLVFAKPIKENQQLLPACHLFQKNKPQKMIADRG